MFKRRAQVYYGLEASRFTVNSAKIHELVFDYILLTKLDYMQTNGSDHVHNQLHIGS